MKDATIKAMERALDPTQALKLLRRTNADDSWSITRVLKIETVKHRPARRLTVRYTVAASRGSTLPGTHTLFGKAYRGHGGERVHALLEELGPGLPEGLRFPRPLGYSRRHRFLLTEALPGAPLGESLALPEGEAHLAVFGDRLAALHRLSASAASRTHDARAEITVLNRAQACVGTASPLGPEFETRYRIAQKRTREALRTGLGAGGTGTLQLIHRDLYPAQVLVHAGAFGLVDLDEVARGEAELDVGNFVAHLLLGDLQGRGTIGPSRAQARTFCTSHAKRLTTLESRLRAYTAATLLRLASLERISRPSVSVLRWPRLAEALLEEAEQLLDDPWPFGARETDATVPGKHQEDPIGNREE